MEDSLEEERKNKGEVQATEAGPKMLIQWFLFDFFIIFILFVLL